MTPDAMSPDAMSPDAMAPDAAPPDAMPLPPDGIQDVLDAPDGPVALDVALVWVTYTKALVGGDAAGFFVQRDPTGPALFVAVDPAILTPSPAVGDQVSFTVDNVLTTGGLRMADAISSLSVASSGGDVAGLVQDVSNAADLVSMLDSYNSELITVSGTITSAFGGAGGGHSKADFDTAAIIGSPDLALRMPDAVAADLNLTVGCTFTTSGTPLWRFNAEAQAHIWQTSEITAATACSAPQVVNAVALSGTEAIVEFDRAIDAASITDAATQFTMDNGLTVSAAAVAGRRVTLTTSAQVGGTTYTVTVAASVADIFGTGVDAAANTASFSAYEAPATVRINEIAASIGGGCDLIELRVVAGGSMEGFAFTERGANVFTFPRVAVATNDFVMLHFNGGSATCNPGSAGNETNAADEFPNATYGANFDTAWDLYSTDTGLTGTDNVFEIRAPGGAILDAVLASDDPTGTAAGGSESAAAAVAAAGEWTNPDGTVPAGGYIDDVFSANAVLDLNAPDTIQRLDNNDNNHKDDWTSVNVAATWAAMNAGQTNF